MAAKRKLTDELLVVVVELIAAGASISGAAAGAGVAHTTLLRRLDRDPELQRRVRRVQRAASRRALRAEHQASREQPVSEATAPASVNAIESSNGAGGEPIAVAVIAGA